MKNLEDKNPKEDYNAYLRYSSLAFEMMAIIFIFTFGGYKLDEYFGIEKHIFTLVLTLFGLGLSLFHLIRKLLNNK